MVKKDHKACGERQIRGDGDKVKQPPPADAGKTVEYRLGQHNVASVHMAHLPLPLTPLRTHPPQFLPVRTA